MRYLMRQSRDGETEIVDRAPDHRPANLRELVRRPRWGSALIWFMRTMAWVWLAKGLLNWSVVIGFNRAFGDFAMLPHALQSSLTVFAVLDLMAAVGLWLAAPWGGLLWAVSAVTETLTPLMGSRGSFVNSASVAISLALIGAYFLLRWRAGQERA